MRIVRRDIRFTFTQHFDRLSLILEKIFIRRA